MSAPFEADLCPETGAPRIRFNFPNGWSASVLLAGATRNPCKYLLASLAICPIGKWGAEEAELLGTEMDPEEVARCLADTSMRPAP